MKKLILILMLAISQTTLFAQTTWTNDKQHTQVKFIVTHLGVSSVTGWFKDVEITITASKANFSDAKFQLTAKTASIFTGVPPRDSDLRSSHLFDVSNYPEMTFKSKSVVPTGKDHYKVTGYLSLHGVTKIVTMNLWYRGTINNPISKSIDAGFQVTGTIKRSDYNLGGMYPAAIIGNDITILADAEFGKSK